MHTANFLTLFSKIFCVKNKKGTRIVSGTLVTQFHRIIYMSCNDSFWEYRVELIVAPVRPLTVCERRLTLLQNKCTILVGNIYSGWKMKRYHINVYNSQRYLQMSHGTINTEDVNNMNLVAVMHISFTKVILVPKPTTFKLRVLAFKMLLKSFQWHSFGYILKFRKGRNAGSAMSKGGISIMWKIKDCVGYWLNPVEELMQSVAVPRPNHERCLQMYFLILK